MRHIIRGNPGPAPRRACEMALQVHQDRFGEYGPQRKRTNYTVSVGSMKFTVEIVNRSASYVATAMIRARRLRSLPAQVR